MAGSITVVAFVLILRVFQFYELEVGAPGREASQARQAFDALLASPDPQRFSKALMLAQSLEQQGRRQAMLWDLHGAISGLSGSASLAETEFAAALATARAVNACPEFIPTVQVRRMQPSELVQILQDVPTALSCSGLDKQLIKRVIERCAGPWSARCAEELPLQGLIVEANVVDPTKPKHVAGKLTTRAWVIRELVKSVWPQQRLDQ